MERSVLARLALLACRLLQNSSDADDQRIFSGLKFLLPGFYGLGKFGMYFFGWLDLSRDFLGVFKTI